MNQELHLQQDLTRPPFKMHLKPGYELVVKMEAAPVLDIVNGPSSGNYSAHIRAQGAGWNATVPVAENFHGLRLGVLATLETTEDFVYRPDSFYPNQSDPSPLKITLINSEKSEQHITVNSKRLPPGITLRPQSVVVAAGQSTTVALPFSIHWNGVKLAASQTARLEVVSEAGKKELPFVFTVRPSSKHFVFSGNDGPTWSADYTIHRDGTFEFSYHVANDNLAVNRDFTFTGTWNGTRVISLAGRVNRDSTTSDHYGFKMSFIEQNFELMLQTDPVLNFSFKNSL